MHDIAARLRETPDAHAATLLERARTQVFRAPIGENDELLTGKPLKTGERIAAIAAREAEWARQSRRDLAMARDWLAQARARLP